MNQSGKHIEKLFDFFLRHLMVELLLQPNFFFLFFNLKYSKKKINFCKIFNLLYKNFFKIIKI